MLTSSARGLGTIRLTLVIPSLGPGGAERVLSLMANYWASKGSHVTVVTISDTSRDHYALVEGVRRVALDQMHDSSNKLISLFGGMRRVVLLRRAFRAAHAEVVIGFGETTSVLAILAAAGTDVRVIVAERTDPRVHKVPVPWNRLRRWTYPRAEMVIVQTQALVPWAAALVGEARTRVIENPVRLLPSPHPAPSRGPRQRILGVGRIDHFKGFDILLRAFASLSSVFPGWDVLILGDGPERLQLQALAERLGIAERLSLPGVVPDPAEFMAASDIFVLSSRYEGFPNVLLEAMASGMAVISADCPSGPREIIREGFDGLLVAPEDPTSLADAMRRLITNGKERKRLGRNAIHVRERFALGSVMTKWDEAIVAAYDSRAAFGSRPRE